MKPFYERNALRRTRSQVAVTPIWVRADAMKAMKPMKPMLNRNRDRHSSLSRFRYDVNVVVLQPGQRERSVRYERTQVSDDASEICCSREQRSWPSRYEDSAWPSRMPRGDRDFSRTKDRHDTCHWES